MFTKKTRILSALVTVCMLISMLACFVVPAVAVETVTHVDTSGMTNLNGITVYPGAEAVKDTNYVITDIQGMKNLSDISQTRGNSWTGATIYLGADIDMNWESFDGFGVGKDGYKANGTVASNVQDNGYYSFKGSFDGNGYVIKNLYINRPDEICVGLFNWYFGGSGGELRNIVIENGIVIGGANTGSLVGKSWNGTIMNCHSNAVVISDATTNGDNTANDGFDANTNYVGGLVGQERICSASTSYVVARQSEITDSSFSGTVLDCGVDVTDTVGIYSGGPQTASSIDGSVVEAADSKTSGFHAWKLNSLVEGSFWKVDENGRVAEAVEATQTRKLTVHIGENELEAYGSEGETVALSSLFDTEGATITLADEAAGSLEDGVFTFGAGDDEITAELPVKDTDYQTLKALYDQKSAYWGEEIGSALENINETFTAGGYENQAEMDEDIEAVAALFTADANDKVPASAAFDAVTLNCGVTIPSFAAPADKVYKNIGIYDTQDLLYIEAVQSAEEGAKYAADQTIYLCKKVLDLNGSTFSQIKELKAGFDGQGNTIKNYSPEAVTQSGFFHNYDGPFVKNVVFDYDEGVTFASLGNNGGLVISDYRQHSGAEKGVLENIIIRHTNASVTENNGFALLVARFGGGTFKVENILIENNKIDSTKKNNAMLAIRTTDASTVDFTNITIRNNTFGKNADNNSWLIVELNNSGAGSTWKFKDVLIHGNTIPGSKSTAVLMRDYFSTTNPITVKFTNVMAFNNDAHYLACYRAYETATTTYIDTNVMTAENVYVENGNPSRIRHYASATSTYTTLEDLKDTTTMKGFASGTVLGEKEDFVAGKYAYAFNQAEVAEDETKTYVQMVDKVPVFCDEAKQTRKLTINDGETVAEVYGSAGETVDLSAYGKPTEPTVGTLNGTEYTFGDADATLSVIKSVSVEEVTLSSDTLELDVKNNPSAELVATVLPEGATNPEVTWKSDDETVATVEDGVVTAVGKGTATITVTTVDGEKTATCTVTVTDVVGDKEAADKKAADDVDALIAAIGEVELEDEEAIMAARDAYDALTDAQKAKVATLATLEAAEAKLAELKAADEKAKADAAAFDAKVDAIGEVTLEDADAIAEARAAYEALDEAAKAYATKEADLKAAEDKLAELKAADEKAKADAAAFDAMVDAIGEVTLEDANAIAEARAAYEALDEAAKAYATKEADLKAAEDKLAELKADAAAVAEVGGVKYATLAEAIEMAEPGATITLLKDIVHQGDKGIFFGKNLTLNLNDNNIDAEGSAIVAISGAKLEIIGEGNVTANTDKVGDGVAVWAHGGANIVIRGGSYKTNVDTAANDPLDHTNDTIYTTENGTIDIYGGTFTQTDHVWVLNCYDQNEGTLKVYGGTFVGFDPANTHTTGHNVGSYVAVGHHSYKDETENKWYVHETDLVIDEGKDATYEEPGKTEGSHCGTCGTVFVEQEVLPKLERILTADNMVDDFLYLEGVRIDNYNLVEYKGNIYYVHDYHKVLKNATVYVSDNLVIGTTYTAGYYTFDEFGVMSKANGAINGNYYVNGAMLKAYQLVKDANGDYYYVSDGNKLATGNVYLTAAVVAGTDLEAGYHWFNEDGKLDDTKAGVIDGYFYLNGERQKAYQVIKYNGDYYYVGDYHKLARNKAIYTTIDGKTGYYWFGDDYKKGGTLIDNGYLYLNGVRQKAYNLVTDGTNYYYVSDYHKAVVNRSAYLTKAILVAAGLDLAPGYYNFNADGQLVIE